MALKRVHSLGVSVCFGKEESVADSQRALTNPAEARLAAIYEHACQRMPAFRKGSRWVVYQILARFGRRPDWTFMNYGYAPVTGDESPLILEDADEQNRFCINLYHRVAGAVDLTGRRVLEVGSGRGGGASFIKRYLAPAEMVGVDFTRPAVSFCRRRYQVPNLSFCHGDAECLPFEPASFDALVNLESSHCYASMSQFLREVARVLRPGGHLLFADFRWHDEIELLDRQMAESGLDLLLREDITPRIIMALELDQARKLAQICESSPRWLVGMMQEFAGAPGSRIHGMFSDGSATYLRFVLRKPS